MHERPQKVRVTLYTLSRIEDQAITSGQIARISIRYKRIVLNKSNDPSGNGRQHVQANLGLLPVPLKATIKNI
ncbi:unannotated protein [freshwater metagenome]|uniref:Unannotated protein n=1 Tax=freshwater metagenome TaxID=449393 RepID=A0A6J7NT54_9ZZZZ